MPVAADEDIVRGILTDKWDAQAQRVSPSLFKGQNGSVSRLPSFRSPIIGTCFESAWKIRRNGGWN